MGSYRGSTIGADSEDMFGGVRPQIRRLVLCGVSMPPTSICSSSLVCLSLGPSSTRFLAHVLNQWVPEIDHPNLPALQSLIITGLREEINPLGVPFPAFSIPKTLKSLYIRASMVVCRFICMARIPLQNYIFVH